MKTYELTYIISPEISLEEAQGLAKEIESDIQAKDGAILRQDSPTAKTLCYPIKKRASGFIGVFEFQLEPDKLNELQAKIQKDGKFVRHLVIIKEPARKRKERRVKSETVGAEPKAEINSEEKSAHDASHSDAGGEKVELKDIEQKLDEILGQ